MCRAEWCILWRRIAGGLSAAHQRALTDAWSGMFRPRAKKAHYGPHEASEIWRLLGSLESIAIPVKTEIGNFLMERLERRIDPPLEKAGWWAIGRLGARVPAYGPLNTIVPTDVVELWIARILSRIPSDPEMIFAVVQMTRPTGDRYRDVSDS